MAFRFLFSCFVFYWFLVCIFLVALNEINELSDQSFTKCSILTLDIRKQSQTSLESIQKAH